MAVDVKEILRCCQKYQYISFDVFDTLLKRDVYTPTDVFQIVARVVFQQHRSELDFCTIRKEAEKAARAKSAYPEITLDEIYAEVHLPDADKQTFKQLELEAESALLHFNPEMREVFCQLLAQGKEIFLVSDMYLPQDFLEQILEREGIAGYRRLYVSCAYRAKKRSGALFRVLLDSQKLKGDKILHIGDSWYADVIGPRKAGIRGLHIERHPRRTLYMTPPTRESSLEKRALYSFLNTHVGNLSTRAERLGYEVLGPIIYTYCTWIHQHGNQMPDAKIWFAARDMYLFAKAYTQMYGEQANCQYVNISRKSLRPIFAQAAGSICASGEVFARGKYSLQELLQYMGYGLEDVEIESSLDLQSPQYDARKLDTYPEVQKILNSPTIRRKESALAATAKAYLHEMGLFENDVVLVDVGWHGTTQYLLDKIQKSQCAAHRVSGLYLGCLDGTEAKIGAHSYQTFLFNEHDSCRFMVGIILFESLILAPHGSTAQYEFVGDGVSPILEESTAIPSFLREVQAGAMQFVQEFQNSCLSNSIQLSPEMACEAFENLAFAPRKDELASIGPLEYDNFYCNKMASPQRWRDYLRHPRELQRDLKYAPWRIGFLYQLLKLRLPYGKIYSFFRKQRGKKT